MGPGPWVQVAVAAALSLVTAGGLAEPLVGAGTTQLLHAPLGEWTTQRAVRLFRGAELFGHIDGGAEIFLELGFVEAAVAQLHRGGARIDVELYRMSDAAAALGIYLARCGAETPDRRLTARHTVGQHQLQLLHGSFYLGMDTPEATTVTPAELVDLAATLVGRLPEEPVPDVLAGLPQEGRVAGSERVIRGPVGLSALFTLGEGDIMSLGSEVTAVAATYLATSTAPAHTLIVATYPDAAAAAAALAHIRANLDQESTVLAVEATYLIFRDYSHRFGMVSRRDARLEVRCNLAERPAASGPS